MRRAAFPFVLASWLALSLAATGCAKKDAVRPNEGAATATEAPPPDTRELTETIRKMRESKTSEENLREAIGTLRNEWEARAVASAVPPPAGHGPGAVGAAAHREGRSGAGNLAAQVRVKIDEEGKVTEVKVEKSSGDRDFDESVLRAIRKASPLPVPPEELRAADHDVYEFPIGFSIQEGAR